MTKENLSQNMSYIKDNIDKLLNLYRDKYVLVYEQEVVGSFDNYEMAADEGVNTYGIDSGFLVHFISDELPINYLALALL